MSGTIDRYSALERRLLNDFQRDLPLSPTPFADMADELGVSEEEVLDTLRALQDDGAVSRVGAVFRPNTVGASTLVAASVPAEDVERVATIINRFHQVNHNYERNHDFNLWFVVTASDQAELDRVLGEIEQDCGYPLMSLPMLQDYFIDLGFDLRWT
jgi:DNA-binding Lrp family transcriptional regulator